MVFYLLIMAPFIFINVLGLKPSHFGYLGLIMADSVSLGSFLAYTINARFKTLSIIQFSCCVNLLCMICFAVFSMTLLHYFDNLTLKIALVMIPMSIFYLAFGLAIPNILSNALVAYQHCLGTAGSLLGLVYYTVVSLVIFGIGLFKTPSIATLVFYFAGLSVLLFTTMFLLKSLQN